MYLFSLSSKDIEGFFNSEDRIADLFSWLEEEFARQGKLVCRFVVNGKKLSESQEIDWAPRPLSDLQTVQVYVQGEKDLVLDVLRLWIDALPELEAFVESRLVPMSSVGGAEFVDAIRELTEQQESFVESLIGLKGALRRLEVDLSQWSQLEKALHQYVTECIRAIETKNYLQLLRTVEYDGCEVFRCWKDQLSRTHAEVKNKSDQDARTVLDLSQLKSRTTTENV